MSVRSEILVSCNDQVLKITEAPVLASGGLNEVRVVFDFCDKWKGFAKTATFYRDIENVYYAVVDENDACVVPWEVCYESGTFFFGVFGEKENTRRTSVTVRYKVKDGAITAEMTPSDPTPEMYDQIVAMLADMRESQAGFISLAEKAIADANTATQNAQTATTNANTATVDANTATTRAYQAAENANASANNANAEADNAMQATAKANEATTNANKAASNARTATEETNTARETFLQDAGEILSSLSGAVYATPIECAVTGDVIAVNDASNQQLAGLNIYGKTTQNGTPTPSAPVPLDFAGESGSIGVTVAGKNLLDKSLPMFSKVGCTKEETQTGIKLITLSYGGPFYAYFKLFPYDVIAGKTVTFSTKITTTSELISRPAFYVADADLGNKVFLASGTDQEDSVATFTAPLTYEGQGKWLFISLNANRSTTEDAGIYTLYEDLMLSISNGKVAYEPYKGQTATFSASGGLHGIGDVCDEIDFARGVRVQRIGKYVVNADDVGNVSGTTVYIRNKVFYQKASTLNMLCNRFNKMAKFCGSLASADGTLADGQMGHYYTTDMTTWYLYFKSSLFTDLDTAKAWFAANETVLVYPLDEPIETPLSAEELAAYATLHTNKPNTTVFNDGGAEMKLAYNADTKLYIDNKINELATAILNNA